jgi:hypothetical protein
MSSNLTSIDDERSPSPALPVIGKQDPETGPTAQERFTDGPEPVSIPADQLSGPLASLYDFRPVIKLLPVSATSSDAVQQVEMQKCKRKGLPLSASSQRLQAMLASTGVPKDTPKPTEANGNRRPARMRRAAGGGAVGVRDVEDIIIDWLDRYGTPVSRHAEIGRLTIRRDGAGTSGRFTPDLLIQPCRGIYPNRGHGCYRSSGGSGGRHH